MPTPMTCTRGIFKWITRIKYFPLSETNSLRLRKAAFRVRPLLCLTPQLRALCSASPARTLPTFVPSYIYIYPGGLDEFQPSKTHLRMASPIPSPQPKSDSPDSHYFVLTIAVVAIMLIVSNVIAFACCSPCRLVEALRRFFRRPEVSTGGTNDTKTVRVIPALKYHNEEEDEENASDSGCSVCLSPFLNGEYIRQLPPCKHTFHAACIDMWLYSHSNCPLCRASVPVRPPRRPTAAAGVDSGAPHRTDHGDMANIAGALV